MLKGLEILAAIWFVVFMSTGFGKASDAIGNFLTGKSNGRVDVFEWNNRTARTNQGWDSRDAEIRHFKK